MTWFLVYVIFANSRYVQIIYTWSLFMKTFLLKQNLKIEILKNKNPSFTNLLNCFLLFWAFFYEVSLALRAYLCFSFDLSECAKTLIFIKTKRESFNQCIEMIISACPTFNLPNVHFSFTPGKTTKLFLGLG